MRHIAPTRVRFICISIVVLLAAQAGTAFGHAARSGSTPKDGARLDSSPSTVRVDYAEPPTNTSVFTVTDGCGDDVTGEVAILNKTIEATLDEGQPGKWAVEWRVLSAVDGHLTKDGIDFRVAGDPDCSQAAPEEDDGPAADPGTSIPLVPIALATAAVLAVAVAIRFQSRSDTDSE